MLKKTRLMLLSALAISMLVGCLRAPIDERGTIYTPAPTAVVTVDPNEPPLEEWAGLFIPKRCTRGVPSGWTDNGLDDISPSGQWIAYESRYKYNYHFSIYNMVTGEWRTPSIPARSYGARWDAGERGLYYLAAPMGEKPEDRKMWWIDLQTLQAKVVRDCPHCVAFDVSETSPTLATMRAIKRGWKQIDLVGWTEPFTTAVTVDILKQDYFSSISLSPGSTRLAYDTELGMRVAELSSGTIVTLPGNSMAGAAWLTDDVILAPDPDALRVWKHNLATGERVMFAEVEGDLSSVYGRQRVYVGLYGAAIARDTRLMLFTPTVDQEYRFLTGTIYIADLRCSRLASAEKR